MKTYQLMHFITFLTPYSVDKYNIIVTGLFLLFWEPFKKNHANFLFFSQETPII